MKFRGEENCPHYSKATKYDRACYYEPMCWKGWLDLIISAISLRFRREKPERRKV